MSVAAMWFILGIILLAVELVSPVFVLFFFGLGAWAAGVTALFVDDLAIEVVVFGASSVVFLLSLRRLFVRSFRGKTQISSDAASVGLPNLCLLYTSADCEGHKAHKGEQDVYDNRQNGKNRFHRVASMSNLSRERLRVKEGTRVRAGKA